jgi:hypothetical protein
VNVVVVNGEVNVKLLNVTLASNGAGPPVIAVETMSSIENELAPWVTTFALATPVQPIRAVPAATSSAAVFVMELWGILGKSCILVSSLSKPALRLEGIHAMSNNGARGMQ